VTWRYSRGKRGRGRERDNTSQDELSTVPPGQYQSRFVKFMQQVIVKVPDPVAPVSILVVPYRKKDLLLKSPRSRATKDGSEGRKKEEEGGRRESKAKEKNEAKEIKEKDREKEDKEKGRAKEDKEKGKEKYKEKSETPSKSDMVASPRNKRDTKSALKIKKK
jgi:hypothetical protein